MFKLYVQNQRYKHPAGVRLVWDRSSSVRYVLFLNVCICVSLKYYPQHPWRVDYANQATNL